MANKGNKKEWKVMALLRKQGWTVTRAAGSHSPFDLIALKGDQIRFIQLKYGSDKYLKYGSKKEEEIFLSSYKNGSYKVSFEFTKLRIGERFKI